MPAKSFWSFLVLLTIIILLSFRFFSSLYYPALNSDHAVTVLMVHSFSLPHDWYFWGQDRMGSLIPLLGNGLVKLFHLKALTAESLSHYGLLIMGYFFLATFLKKYYSKLILAVFWFFPPSHMIDITQLSFGIHYSLLAGCCFMIKINKEKQLTFSHWKFHLHMFLFVLCAITAVWVSELALIPLVILVVVDLLFLRSGESGTFFRNPDLYYFIITAITGYLFIGTIKEGTVTHNYSGFNNLQELSVSFEIFFNSLFQLFCFDKAEPMTAIYLILATIFILVLIRATKNGSCFSYSQKIWFWFFIADAVLMMILFLSTKWTLENNVPRRYFTCNYISLGMALMIRIDSLEFSRSTLLNRAALSIVFIGGIGTIYNLKFVFPATLTPKSVVMSEYASLGNIGIIGNYWNSYISMVNDPEAVIATSNDDGAVRNLRLAEAVFHQDKIYINRDTWLDSFPDTLHQFGRTLIKAGDEIFIGDSHLCEYRLAGSSGRQ